MRLASGDPLAEQADGAAASPGSIRRANARWWILPEPDSPTSPSVSPCTISKLTPIDGAKRRISRRHASTAKPLRGRWTPMIDQGAAQGWRRVAGIGRCESLRRAAMPAASTRHCWTSDRAARAKRQPGDVLRRIGMLPCDGRQARRIAVQLRHRGDQAHGVGMHRLAKQVGYPGAFRPRGRHTSRSTRRANSAITPMSWEISITDMPIARLQVAQQFQNLRLDRDVERRGRFVGDQQPRPAGDGDGDHDALAHAAGQSVRIISTRRPRRESAPARAVRSRAGVRAWRRGPDAGAASRKSGRRSSAPD